ncbi:MAG: glycosyltransferase, partial [Lachnospiraceae bacterium]|nr:glycosyltransferase [Lachnospiraceae bacterium]
DNRRAEMRELADRMGVGYFDRPDNAGAKAGNLNHAMGLTNAPYVVTFDADMIPKSDFLMKTIPYFIDAEERCAKLPEGTCRGLGFLQTPQSFYTPDVFQHTLYAEHRAVNEQDFFYRTIEAAKTSTNSVIYGGSNTVLSRRAIEAAGGFFTGSITEDFATGMLIEAAGYLSLAIPEPLASGQAPQTFREHIRQRTRWGRGVISTAKQLDFLHRAELTPFQKLSYWSSVVYWFSPLKTLIYMISPLLFSVFFIPVFRCTWPELLLYWLPMFIMQELCLRIISGNSISVKWSGIYETVLMPHLLLPILQEAFGISLTTFKVTDKSGASRRRKRDITAMLPFAALAVLCAVGIARVLLLIRGIESIGMFILLFWLFRNLYFLLMALFVTDGRDSDDEPVHVRDAEPVTLRSAGGDMISGGITTHLTEHSVKFFLDEAEGVRVGAHTRLAIETADYKAELSGVVTGVERIRGGEQAVCEMEILDFGEFECEYLQILYDRVPTLPQDLRRDFGILPHLWRNIAGRLARQFT